MAAANITSIPNNISKVSIVSSTSMPLLNVVCSADNTTLPTTSITNYSAGAALRISSNGWYNDSGGANIEIQNVVPSVMSNWRIQSFANTIAFRDLGVSDNTYTAQAGGSSSTIKLNSGSSSINDYYKNWFITITNGVGSGDYRLINGYNGSTKVATVASNWTGDVSPDATSTYILSPSYSFSLYAQGGGASLRGTLTSYYGSLTSYGDANNQTSMNYSGDNTISCVQNTRVGAYQNMMSMLNSASTTSGDVLGLEVGVAKSSKNTAQYGFKYVASGDNGNAATIGLYQVASIAEFRADRSTYLSGKVGILQAPGTEALEVTGNIKSTGTVSNNGLLSPIRYVDLAGGNVDVGPNDCVIIVTRGHATNRLRVCQYPNTYSGVTFLFIRNADTVNSAIIGCTNSGGTYSGTLNSTYTNNVASDYWDGTYTVTSQSTVRMVADWKNYGSTRVWVV